MNRPATIVIENEAPEPGLSHLPVESGDHALRRIAEALGFPRDQLVTVDQMIAKIGLLEF